MISDAILITGAGQRIGEYLAQQFLAQHQPVVFTYRTERPAVDALEAQGALGFQVDFTQPDQLTQFLQDLPQQVASLRAVIHNASLWLPDSKIEAADMLSDLMTVHVTAPYQINQACAPLLRKSQAAVTDIIALSDAKVSKGHADYAGYLASKAGLESLTLSFAKAFAPNIKVNTIAPGLVIFNEGDSEAYKKARLAESAIPVEPGMDSIWQAVQFLMNSPNATGSTVSLEPL
ncbi:dihydromonapterin reductase [Hydrogenovibrio sp. 3SP14C1]|uniref:dihydromonapterin reductase n=1 Tax=Hydrogenovibrio sp. 3SP14C1 TaxID=3038774 RepID=UPI002416A2A6|nr:dihydromonapterin reductase [Hydrogenovibrio sp. 3SP14C1]MDG4812638.1 dihydromonapterin reductase [Hydrogenovibrio sp. 3SP14C1]